VQAGLQVLAAQGKKLSTADAKKAEEYASTVLGSVDFAPWLKLYSAFRGEFVDGWIPDNYIGRIICPAVNGNLYELGNYKTLSKRLLNTEALPDLAYSIHGNWLLSDGTPSQFSEVRAQCFDRHESVFLKKDHSCQGKGVFKLTAAEFDRFDFGKAKDFVLQAPISQHPLLEELSPGAVATLRITTVKPPGQAAQNRLSNLRVARQGMDFFASKEGLRVPLWPEDGRLYGIALTATWKILEKHPDTEALFSGKQVPFYQQAVALCERLHDQIPHLQLIGWDVAISHSGEPKLIEWNTHEPGIVFSEATVGPNFQGLGWENLWKSHSF
jgi:hypothetical protein